MTVDELVESLRSHRQRNGDGDRGRIIVGLAGPPGVGKSTVSERLAIETGAVIAPMDGFHLPNAELDRLDRRGRKGAPDTFDSDAFVGAVEDVCAARRDVAWPTFDRDLDEPVVGGMTSPAEAGHVVVEGNYLLLDDEPWSRLRSLLSPMVYLHVDDDVRRRRLVERHVRFGRSEMDAARFVDESDEANAALIRSTRHRADLVVAVD